MEALLVLAILGLAMLAVILTVVVPIIVAGIAFQWLRRRGVGFKSAIVYSAGPLSLLFAWPLTGLYELSRQCERPSIPGYDLQKLGPIDALLIVGRGSLWWLDKGIDIEMPVRPYEGTGKFVRIEKGTSKPGPRNVVSETELRSRYKLTFGQPEGGNFFNRYLSYAPLKIEDRATGKIVASVKEPAWGGGVLGFYIAVFFQPNLLYSEARYLSCGYAEPEIGVFRGDSSQRKQRYETADRELIHKVFVLPTKAMR